MLKKSISIVLLFLAVFNFVSCELDDSENGGSSGDQEQTEQTDQDNNSDTDNQGQELEIIKKSGNITEDETWEEGYVYYVYDKLLVKATVTIKPGAIVKVGSEKSIYIMDGGKILANGTVDKKILFTSKYDHTGGKISSTTVTPEHRDWEDIYIKSTGSVFNYCEFKYADEALHMGANASDPHKITVTNSVFNGNWTGFSSSVDISEESVINNNSFYNNHEPMIVLLSNKIGTNNSYTSQDGQEKNDRQCIAVSRGYSIAATVEKDITLLETKVPYEINWGIEIKNNSTLTLGDNVVLQMGMGSVIRVNTGSEIDLGSTAIITSNLDDSLKGTPSNGINPRFYWLGIQDGNNSYGPYRTNLDRVFFSEHSSK